MILGKEAATLTRYSAEIRDPTTGRASAVVDETIAFEGSFQPIKGRERAALEEGIRQSVEFKLYTTEEIRTADQTTKRPADTIVWQGETYTVVQVEPWNALLSHYKAYLMRQKE